MRGHGKTIKLLAAILWLIFTQAALSIDFGVIKNPQPNMKENRYIPLLKVAEIGTELGKGQYMFKPHSLTLDRDGNLYIYDNLQAKIFKLDKHLNLITAFGKAGTGAGEFSGTGKMHPVYIKIGRDGKLYAKDLKKKRVLVFEKEGHFLREIMYAQEDYNVPLTDTDGVTHFLGLKEGAVKITGTHPAQNRSFNIDRAYYHYLFAKPTPLRNTKIYSPRPLLGELHGDSLLVYFTPSSVMMVIRGNRLTATFKIWPADALSDYRQQISRVQEHSKKSFKDFFTYLIIDGDRPDIFYLQFGVNEMKKINALYRFNLKGDLVNVLYRKTNESSLFTKFKAQQSGNFYAIEGEKIIIYKEDLQ